MLGRALALYFTHFGAILLTAGVALVPANLLMAGVVKYGLARISAAGVTDTAPPTPQVEERRDDLGRRDLPATEGAQKPPLVGREAVSGGSFLAGRSLRSLGAALYALIAIAVLMFAGLLLAHAALVPLVLALDSGQRAGAHEAWVVVAQRLGPLLSTAVVELALIAIGTVLFILPGLLLAAVFAFAVPATLLEGVAGKAALDRSVAMIRGRWGGVLLMLVLMVIFTAASAIATAFVPGGTWRLVVPGAIRVVTYPLPLVGLCLLYRRRG